MIKRYDLISQKISEKTNKKQRIVFAAAFLVTVAIQLVPIFFFNLSGSGINYCVIFALISGLALAFKVSGAVELIPRNTANIIGACLFAAFPVLDVFIIAPIHLDGYILKNLCIIIIPYTLLFAIFRRSYIPVFFISIVTSVLYILNEVLCEIRGVGLSIADAAALSTALSVASNYRFEFRMDYYFSILATAFACVISIVFPFRLAKLNKSMIHRFVLYVDIAVLFLSVCLSYTNIFNEEFIFNWETQDAVFKRGVCYNMVVGLRENIIMPPNGYSKEAAEKVLGRYSPVNGEHKPNVIVIMNESFADLRDIANITPSEENMPFFYSLNKNVTRGHTVVGAFGGRTSNSEFEFLTGFTMNLLPNDSYPYLQHIYKKTRTFLDDLADYRKIYIHPYIGSNYRRSVIYPLLGFDEFYDGLSFSTQNVYNEKYDKRDDPLIYDGVKMTRGFIGDDLVYDKVISLYENKPENTRIAEFVVTMQNHGAYSYTGEDFTNEITSGIEDTPEIDQYLTLIKKSDDELKRLVEYFSNVDEDVVLVFFGDHMPPLDMQISEKNLERTYSKKGEEYLARYSTPFIIWTNFNTESADAGYVSLNYLSVLMKEKAGMSMSQYDLFLKDMYEEYPVISSNVLQNKAGDYFFNYHQTYDSYIREYDFLQYYLMFDQ